jgi:hypothetical protein
VEASGESLEGVELFEVSRDPRTAAPDAGFESANVCRVAALSSLLGGDQRAIEGLSAELEQLGFPPGLSTGEQNWRDVDPVDLVFGRGFQDFATEGAERVRQWHRITENDDPRAGFGFLVEVLGSQLERESAAASAAIWRLLSHYPGSTRTLPSRMRWARWAELLIDTGPAWPLEFPIGPREGSEGPRFVGWDGESWGAVFNQNMRDIGDSTEEAITLLLLTRMRLDLALRSPDQVTRSLAHAALAPAPVDHAPPPGEPVGESARAEEVSTMIHGTWGWKGSWWRPGGDFHEFILKEHRPNLYSRGGRFSWSGAYSENQRERAARDFLEWTEDLAPGGLQSVFAHSYGGEIAARARLEGTPIKELVLLSVPVGDRVEAAAGLLPRVVDIRLDFDPVLALARSGQRLPSAPNTTVIFLGWRLGHSASHSAAVWSQEDVARQAGI